MQRRQPWYGHGLEQFDVVILSVSRLCCDGYRRARRYRKQTVAILVSQTQKARLSCDFLHVYFQNCGEEKKAPFQSDLAMTVYYCNIAERAPPEIPFTPSRASHPPLFHAIWLYIELCFPMMIFRLLPPLLHPQDLHHPYEDVQEVELEADTLIHHILPRLAPLRQSGMMQDLLRVIEREASENRQATI